MDADACPVKNIIEEVAELYKLKVIMYIDTSHELNNTKSEVVVVSKGIDSVDLKIVSDVKEGDLVITNDFGLASVLLTKKAYVMSPNGLVFTNDNIDRLLFERHIVKENVRNSKRVKNIKKRTKENDKAFKLELINLLNSKLSD